MLSGGSPSLQAGKRGAEGRKAGALCTEEQQGNGEGQGQRSASLPWHLGRGKEGWRARVGGTGWVPSTAGQAEEGKNAHPGEFAKRKENKKNTLKVHQVSEKQPFLSPGLSQFI